MRPSRRPIEPAVLAHDASTQVFQFRKGAAKRHDPIVCVYMESGDVTNHTGFREDDAVLTVDIMHPDTDNVDDLLDAFGDVIEPELDVASIPDITNLLLSGWRYVRDELPGWTALRLTYSIIY